MTKQFSKEASKEALRLVGALRSAKGAYDRLVDLLDDDVALSKGDVGGLMFLSKIGVISSGVSSALVEAEDLHYLLREPTGDTEED